MFCQIMQLQKHARSKCVSSPLLRAGFCIISQNFLSPAYKYFPGDLIAIVKPSLVDKRGIHLELTPRQIEEYDRYLVCTICNKTCAGTCSSSSE